MSYDPSCPINKQEFRRWLKRYEPDQVIGINQTDNLCPLARYLADDFFFLSLTEAMDVSVHPDKIQISDRFSFVPPEWAKQFIEAVDKIDHFDNRVTAQEALHLL